MSGSKHNFLTERARMCASCTPIFTERARMGYPDCKQRQRSLAQQIKRRQGVASFRKKAPARAQSLTAKSSVDLVVEFDRGRRPRYMSRGSRCSSALGCSISAGWSAASTAARVSMAGICVVSSRIGAGTGPTTGVSVNRPVGAGCMLCPSHIACSSVTCAASCSASSDCWRAKVVDGGGLATGQRPTRGSSVANSVVNSMVSHETFRATHNMLRGAR